MLLWYGEFIRRRDTERERENVKQFLKIVYYFIIIIKNSEEIYTQYIYILLIIHVSSTPSQSYTYPFFFIPFHHFVINLSYVPRFVFDSYGRMRQQYVHIQQSIPHPHENKILYSHIDFNMFYGILFIFHDPVRPANTQDARV